MIWRDSVAVIIRKLLNDINNNNDNNNVICNANSVDECGIDGAGSRSLFGLFFSFFSFCGTAPSEGRCDGENAEKFYLEIYTQRRIRSESCQRRTHVN